MMLTGACREEVARILEIVAKDGLPGPRDLDVALDAIGSAIDLPSDDEASGPDDADAEFEWIGGKLVSLPGWKRDDNRTHVRIEMAACEIPVEILRQWSDDECRDAEIWALSVHYLASDNDVLVPPMPPHVKRYWDKSATGEGLL